MDDFANVWPHGGLLAFSGVDGPTAHDEPFVAAGAKQGIGWNFWLKPAVQVLAAAGGRPLSHRRAPTDFCLSDCWHCTTPLEDYEGYVEGAFVDRSSIAMEIAFPSLPEGVVIDLGTEGEWETEGGVSVCTGSAWWLAVFRESPGLKRRFGVAISYASREDAVEAARRACVCDLAEVIEQRLEFYKSVTVPDSLTGNTRRAYYKAVAIEKVNTESPQMDIGCRWTTPDRMPHRHMWMWDSAFHALGLQHLSQELSRDAVRALFTKQLPDGLIQLAAQPGPPLSERIVTQPPLLAWSICRQSERHMDIDYLNDMYPRLVRYLDWYEKNRKRDNGLYGWDIWTEDDPVRGARGSESGMDNSPRFDNIISMTAVDLSAYMASEYYSIEKIARCLDKRADVAEWRDRRLDVAALINELLWDDEDRFYYDLDEVGEFVTVKTPAGFMPLLGQVPDGDRAEALRMHLMHPGEFWLQFPLPSVARDESSYSKDTWRGPVWLNVNTLVYYGLMAYGFFQEARQLARISMQEVVRHYVRHGAFYEFYDSEGVVDPASLPRKGGVGEIGGVGFGVIEDFHWTAACFINFANEIG